MKYKILVNRDNKFNNNYLNKINLIDIVDVNDKSIKVEENTYKAYLELKKYMESKNIFIGITSAYRDIDYQKQIYDESLEEFGEEHTNNYVAIPGYSEHHTGLALDIGVLVDGKYLDEDSLKTNDLFLEMHKHLHKYGFILRYPKGKETITGYNYEPWHIRYVGNVVASIIYENNYTFEEYLKNFNCVLYINKPTGITSFDVVKDIINIFGIKKVGHTGTLDPIASGVMLITIGQATKIVELLTAEDKEYIAGVSLGFQTDTYDTTGEVMNRKDIPNNINIHEVLNNYKKTYMQEVPIYSAIKVKGKKLYEYARNNKKIELPKKEVTIKEIELISREKDSFIFKALVTKGTYIRSLINDIGKDLGTFATMNSLERTKQGRVTIEDTNSLEDINNNNYKYHLITEVLGLPQVKVDSNLEKKIKNGVKVEDKWQVKDKVIFINPNNKILGIFEKHGNLLRTWKNFY